MAKIVIAGKSNCPYYARAELLGDKLSLNLPDFKLHKIVVVPEEWEKWLKETCNSRGWEHNKSPLVWRELIDRGGKGVLIGGANEFQEYAHGYYGIQSAHISNDMTKMAAENKVFKEEEVREEAEYKARSNPLYVCITNATSPTCYSMISAIAQGEVFGHDTEIALRLLDSNEKQSELEGLQMEAVDLAYGPLRIVEVTSDVKKAFTNCAAIILLDEIEKKESEGRESYVKREVEHFVNYAKVMNEVAKKNVKVLMAGCGPVNLDLYMMIQNAPNIPRQNFVGLSRLLENNAKSVVAERLNVNSNGVVDLIIWGNVNGDNYIDISNCRVHGYDGAIWGPPTFSLPAREMLWDKKWLDTEFIELVRTKKTRTEELLKHGASMSQGAAIATLVQQWWNGSPAGQMFSLAVYSEGWFDVPEGLVCSFPVILQPKGDWSVVQDITLTEEVKAKIKLSVKDIESDKHILFPPPKPPTPPPVAEVKVTIIDPKDEVEKKDEEKKDSSESESEQKLATIVEEKEKTLDSVTTDVTPEKTEEAKEEVETAQE